MTVLFVTKRGHVISLERAVVEAAGPALLAALRAMVGDALDGGGPCWCSEQDHDPWCAALRAAVKPFWPAWEEWGLGRVPGVET